MVRGAHSESAKSADDKSTSQDSPDKKGKKAATFIKQSKKVKVKVRAHLKARPMPFPPSTPPRSPAQIHEPSEAPEERPRRALLPRFAKYSRKRIAHPSKWIEQLPDFKEVAALRARTLAELLKGSPAPKNN